jgi:hypothetical protein
MDADRERAYNGAGRRAAQNFNTAYRSQWAVNAARDRRFPVAPPPAEGRPVTPPAGRLPLDLGPLMRLAQEACWGRFFNRPRHSAIADA